MNEERRQKLFKLIERLGAVKLCSDPVESGLTAFNEKIAEVSNKRSKAAILGNKINRALFYKKKQLITLEDAYNLRFDRLMAYDRRVKACSNKSEMESTCRSILHKEQAAVSKLRMKVEELEAYNTCINSCLKTLQHAKESLSKQLNIINHQMSLGEVDRGKYGDT